MVVNIKSMLILFAVLFSFREQFVFLIQVMRVHLIKKQTIEDYAAGNSGSRVGLQIWLGILKYAVWATPEDIQI